MGLLKLNMLSTKRVNRYQPLRVDCQIVSHETKLIIQGQGE